MKCKTKSEQRKSFACENSSSTPQSHSCSSSHSSSPPVTVQQEAASSYVNSGTRLKISCRENWFQRQEAEMNVDTGFTVVNSECSLSPLSWFSRDLQGSLLQPRAANCPLGAAGSSEERTHRSLFSAKRNHAAGPQPSNLHGRLSRANHSNGNEEEEEFFIWLEPCVPDSLTAKCFLLEMERKYPASCVTLCFFRYPRCLNYLFVFWKETLVAFYGIGVIFVCKKRY